jgi:hypothetical protein
MHCIYTHLDKAESAVYKEQSGNQYPETIHKDQINLYEEKPPLYESNPTLHTETSIKRTQNNVNVEPSRFGLPSTHSGAKVIHPPYSSQVLITTCSKWRHDFRW